MTDIDRRRGITFATLVALIALATLAAALAGCAVGPNYVKPATPVAAQFAGTTEGAYSTAEVQAKFWTQFGDPTLDRLIDEALAANHDLRIALANLFEARTERHVAQFDLAPTVTASGGYTKQEFPAINSPSGEPLTQRYYDAGFDAFWELDFFGRVRRNIEAQSAQVESAEAGLRDAQVTVTAEVARTYFELRGEQARFAVAWRNVENQRATLQLTQARFEAGRSTELDTARAQAQLSATLTTIGPLEAAIARSIHRLSVLTGQQPEALRTLLAPPRELPELPHITAIGDPAALLRRRPDVRVAERQLAASTALVGVAIADLFPKVTFTGNFSYAALTPGQLGTSGSRGYTIAPGITYVASYHMNAGGYSVDRPSFGTAVNSPPLHALASATSGGNGVYTYNANSAFPVNVYQSTNYWVDVVFQTP